MPTKMFGHSFPSTVVEMLNDRAFTLMFNAFVLKHANASQKAMYKFLINQPKGYDIYTQYLAPGATDHFSLSSKLQKALDAIMAGPQDKAAKGLTSFARFVHAEIDTVLTKAALPGFFRTKDVAGSPFNKYCVALAEKNCENRFGKMSVVTDRLGIPAPKEVKAIMVALYLDDWDGAVKASAIAAKKVGLKQLPVDIADAVKRQRGLIDFHDVKIDAKKLAICGFSEVNDKNLLKLVTDMATQHLARKKSAAAKIFKQIQKIEPKTSPIARLKYEGMIKLLIQKAALPDYIKP